MSDALTTTVEDGVLVLRLAHPTRNVLDLSIGEALAAAIEDTGDVGAVALMSGNDDFCFGGDVRSFATADDPAEYVGGLAAAFHRVIRAVRAAPPVVVGARGWSAGAGMSLVLCCDVVVLGESAKLQPAYAGIGVTPDGGMSWTLPHMVGDRAARAILLRNQVLDAGSARRLGIADEVVADADVEVTVLDIATRLARGPRAALRSVKRLVAEAAHDTLDAHLDAEARSIAAHAADPDGQEGINAFLERRRPQFRGR